MAGRWSGEGADAAAIARGGGSRQELKSRNCILHSRDIMQHAALSSDSCHQRTKDNEGRSCNRGSQHSDMLIDFMPDVCSFILSTEELLLPKIHPPNTPKQVEAKKAEGEAGELAYNRLKLTALISTSSQ